MSRDPERYEAIDFGTGVRVRPVDLPLASVEEGTRVVANVGVSIDSRTVLRSIEVDSIAFAERDGVRYRDRIASITVHDGNVDMHSRRATAVFAVMRDKDGLYAAQSRSDVPGRPIAVSRIVGGDEGFDPESIPVGKGALPRFVSLPIRGAIGEGDVTIGDGQERRSFLLEKATPAAGQDYSKALEAFREGGYDSQPRPFKSKGLEERRADDEIFAQQVATRMREAQLG